MPRLRGADIPPGSWARPSRVSDQLCPICRTRMHVRLVELGATRHILCGPLQALWKGPR